MMKFRIFLYFILFCTLSNAVSVKMQYTAKKTFSAARKLQLSIADENGNTDRENFNFNALALSNYVYFLAEPLTKEDFTEKDKDLLKDDLRLIQNDNSIKPIDLEINTDDKDNIIGLLFLFNKSEIVMYEDLKIKIGDFSSESVKFDEVYRQAYHQYLSSYEQGEAAYNSSDYIESYRELKVFDTEDPEITSLSFYEKASQMLESSVTQKINFLSSDYEFLKMKSANSIDRQYLAQLDSLNAYVVHCDSVFSEYFIKKGDGSSEVLLNISTELTTLKTESFKKYKDNILSEFTRFDYRSVTDRSFIALLTKLLLCKENLMSIDQPVFDISLIPEDNVHWQVIENFNFTDEFTELLYMIKDNITENNFVFDEISMDNLYQRIDEETEPYYNIYTGINHLLAKEYLSFWNHMLKALYKCTDNDLLSSLELLILFNDEQILNMDESSKENFKDALDAYVSGDIADIEHEFKLIKSLYPDLAVPYYILAQIDDSQGDVFGAYFGFEEMIAYKKEIVSAYVYFINQDLKNSDLQKAEQKVTDVLVDLPAWKLYYLYANILFKQKKYTDAAKVLEENCISLNKNHYGEYILLGDIYYITDNSQKARDYYMEAGRIDKEHPLFKERLQAMEQNSLELETE